MFKRSLPALTAVLALLCLSVGMALAQEIAVVADVPWYQALAIPLLALASVVIAGLLAWLAFMLKAKTGIELDTDTRKALHEALMNGMRAALVALGWLPGMPVPEKEALTLQAEYARAYSPGSLKHFKLDTNPRALKEIGSTYLPTVNPATAPAATALAPVEVVTVSKQVTKP